MSPWQSDFDSNALAPCPTKTSTPRLPAHVQHWLVTIAPTRKQTDLRPSSLLTEYLPGSYATGSSGYVFNIHFSTIFPQCF